MCLYKRGGFGISANLLSYLNDTRRLEEMAPCNWELHYKPARPFETSVLISILTFLYLVQFLLPFDVVVYPLLIHRPRI